MVVLSSQISSIEAISYLALEQDSPEAPIVRAERRLLRKWLATNLSIQWGKRVKYIEHDDDGVSAYFEDGTSARGDILVGADGINSVGMSSISDNFSGSWGRAS